MVITVLPPHKSKPFLVIDNALALLKTPSNGTPPSRLLKERFKFTEGDSSFAKYFGISPDKLFPERS